MKHKKWVDSGQVNFEGMANSFAVGLDMGNERWDHETNTFGLIKGKSGVGIY
jgi:hypothetical protein